jgi:hypothetical protein
MIPLASDPAYPFPEAEPGGKALWVPPVRQTGFLHPTAVISVGTITDECPRGNFACPRCPHEARGGGPILRLPKLEAACSDGLNAFSGKFAGF